MKTKPALFLLALPLSAALAAESPSSPPVPAPSAAQTGKTKLTPGSILAAQISEIMATKDLSLDSRNRQIASAVRLAVTTVVSHTKDARLAAQAVLELSGAATKAAPDFADLIFRTISVLIHDTPLLAGQPGLTEMVRDVVANVTPADSGEAAGAEATNSRAPSAAQASAFHGQTDAVIVSPSH